MELRTSFKIEPSEDKITYRDKVMFIGSCFAKSIGSKFSSGKFPVMINPSGTVFNPVSVSNTLDTILSKKEAAPEDLFFYNGQYLSFNHYTEFSSENQEDLLKRINSSSGEALSFLTKASFLFITFGTARVYRRRDTGEIVSNCHKVKADRFFTELLPVREIVSLWQRQLDRLQTLFPDLKVIFTVSPVRHLKDGVHGNQVSKATLILAVEELLRHQSSPVYFPAYEILMDDLRDYRFYTDDMLHPTSTAIDYIWKLFSESYIDPPSLRIWNEALKITKAVNHKISTGTSEDIRKFAAQMINQINDLSSKAPGLDLSGELIYFNSLTGRL
jgi:hypothetical protein